MKTFATITLTWSGRLLALWLALPASDAAYHRNLNAMWSGNGLR